MAVGIPLCEYGACLLPAVAVVETTPCEEGPSQMVTLCKPLPLCEAHLTLLTVWRGRYQRNPECKVVSGSD